VYETLRLHPALVRKLCVVQMYSHASLFRSKLCVQNQALVLKTICCLDQDLVPKPADQVEAEVHERPGGVGPAVLLLPWGPGPPPHGPGGQALVCTVDGRTQDRLKRYAAVLSICSAPGVRHPQLDLDMQD
jgi:hypothetical protein